MADPQTATTEFHTADGIQEQINNALKNHDAEIVGLSGGVAFMDMDIISDKQSMNALDEQFNAPPGDEMQRDAFLYKIDLKFEDGSTESVVGHAYLADIEKDDINAHLRDLPSLKEWAESIDGLNTQKSFEAEVTTDSTLKDSFFGVNDFYQEIKQELATSSAMPSNEASEIATQSNIFDAQPDSDPQVQNIFDGFNPR